MRHARRSLQRIARLAAVGGLLCGGLMTTTAMASDPNTEPSTRADAEDTRKPGELGASLVSRLGASRTAGSWVGSDGRPVVAVTDADAAAEVGRSGARAKVVRHSMDRLRSATDALRDAPRVPGTAWAMDYKSNEIAVRADSTVSAGDWSRMSRLAEGIGGFVQMERTAEPFTTRLSGGSAVFARSGRCSAGFNVTDGKRNFILTAGHCGSLGTTWFKDTQGTERVGTTTAGEFPGSDFSLVEYENGDAAEARGVVDIGDGRAIRITAAADPVVGQQVFRSGSTTGVRSGRVTALNATVNYPEGTVTGLIETTVCAEEGDSGGPLFSQGLALGVTSGGNGDCTAGGLTYFQPATSAIAALGVSVTGAATAADVDSGAASAPPAATGAPARSAPDGPTLTAGLLSSRTLAPGLLVIGASLVVLIASHWIRAAHDRRSYRRHYSRNWA